MRRVGIGTFAPCGPTDHCVSLRSYIPPARKTTGRPSSDPQLPWARRYPQTILTLHGPVLIGSYAGTGGRILACSAALGGKHPYDLQLSSTGSPNSCGGCGQPKLRHEWVLVRATLEDVRSITAPPGLPGRGFTATAQTSISPQNFAISHDEEIPTSRKYLPAVPHFAPSFPGSSGVPCCMRAIP
jgi:hypothetical protein